jgi:hypothetical protein
MTPEELFHELLGLDLNWEVVESRFERTSGTVFLEIRETPKLWELVGSCSYSNRLFTREHGRMGAFAVPLGGTAFLGGDAKLRPRATRTNLRALRPGRLAARFEHPETIIGNPTPTHDSG